MSTGEVLGRIDAIKITHPNNLAAKNFETKYFDSLTATDQKALLQCMASGIANEDSGMGCYAMQPADYDKFKPFFSKVLSDYHNVPVDAKHENNWSLDGVGGIPDGGRLDLAELGLPALSMRVRVGRNLKDFPLPGAMTKDDRINMEAKMCTAFDVLKEMPDYGGQYHSLTPFHPNFIDEDEYKDLVAKHIMFKDMAADSYLAAAGIASDWPFGRGCYVSEDKQFVIWVGEEDHLRIMCMVSGTVLNDVFDRLEKALDVVNGINGLEFAKSPDYGFVTSCPTNLGTGMRASVHIPLPNLTRDGTDAKAKAIAKPLGLSVRGTGGEHTPIGADGTCDISPSARFCITEAQIITKLYTGLKLLKAEEEKAGLEAADEPTTPEDGTAKAEEPAGEAPSAEATVDDGDAPATAPEETASPAAETAEPAQAENATQPAPAPITEASAVDQPNSEEEVKADAEPAEAGVKAEEEPQPPAEETADTVETSEESTDEKADTVAPTEAALADETSPAEVPAAAGGGAEGAEASVESSEGAAEDSAVPRENSAE